MTTKLSEQVFSKNQIYKEHSFSIKTSIDSLVIREEKFRILPKIKFKRKRDKKIRLNKIELGVYKMNIPFKIREVKRTRSWLGDGIQQDDINCSEDYIESYKVYDKVEFLDFLNRALKYHNIKKETINTHSCTTVDKYLSEI